MRAILFLLILGANSFAAGPILFGARGGTALTDNNTQNAFSSVAGSSALGHNFAIGPTAGVRLPLGFSVEGDALYNRRSLGAGFGGFDVNTHSDWWEFPVMLKFTPMHGPISPVLGAGVSFQHISNFGSAPSYLFTGSTSANSVGFVAGGGVQFRVGALSVTPELRYTRWNGSSFTQSFVDSLTGGRNQAQILVGFTF